MKGKSKKTERQKDMTDAYMSDDVDEDRVETVQRFSARSKHHQKNKTLRTAQMRTDEQVADTGDIQILPIGQVIQVYSRYCDIEFEGKKWLCQVRKTLSKVSGWDIVVGDWVRFRDMGANKAGQSEAMIEQILPRKTLLTRADSFKQIDSHPIVANAEQMLVVASVHEPNVKWGLIDRMLIAAAGGGLEPIVCMNKVDLARDDDQAWVEAMDALKHYASMGIRTLETSVIADKGIEQLRDVLRGRITVLAGHSGVGKSSLIRAIQPDLDLRIGDISGYTGKGRHTTTSARRYLLDIGGYVIDTPGVKVFGLWGVTPENLAEHFPDVANNTAPQWRRESYERIEASLEK